MMMKEDERFENFPTKLSTKILEIEENKITTENRKKFSYLGHLPIDTVFYLIEVEMGDVVSKETMNHFKNELDLRKNKRKNKKSKIIKEKEEEMKKEEEERRIREIQKEFREVNLFVYSKLELKLLEDEKKFQSINETKYDQNKNIEINEQNNEPNNEPKKDEKVMEKKKKEWGVKEVMKKNKKKEVLPLFPSIEIDENNDKNIGDWGNKNKINKVKKN
jgi:hypothetical protein